VSEEQATYICSIGLNRFYSQLAWKVFIHFHNRKTGDSPEKGHTWKSKINRNLCPCKPYDKEFNHFYLLIKISLMFRR